jgi:hypothetical protein
MLYINIILLGISAIVAMLNPSYIQTFAKYKKPEVLIVNWGIYAFTLVLLMIIKDIKIPLLFCYISSIGWNYLLIHNKLINQNEVFFTIALVLNLIGIAEILYYLGLDVKP